MGKDQAESSDHAPSNELAGRATGKTAVQHSVAVRVVGMGGSAGGLEAFGQFFSHLPPDTGLAFVLVPHLEPTHKGMMPELLQRHTKMKVVEVEDAMAVEANRVYIIPPNADLSILNGKLQVLEPVAPRGLRMPIDNYFRHLAADQKEKAIVILFSGMGSDGTAGLRAVKEHSGLAMVQDPASAKFDGMPQSAVNTGLADCIASAEDLAARLVEFIHDSPKPVEDGDQPEVEPSAAMQKVFVLLRARTGNDFSCYKNNTISRRIERRLVVHRFDSLPRYVRFLQENPQEVELLYRELLIGVTSFFRDPGLFDALKDTVIPRLLEDRPKDRPLRVWNPGCSTGEESYSLAIVLKECLAGLSLDDGPAVQIFATDIDTDAIEMARQGRYSAGIVPDVSAERLDRFFVGEGESFRIKREVRDLVVFAPQNILVDPPFTKLDIVCCRNFMIYINAETQKKLLPILHYVLNPGGFLVLGPAEGIGGFEHLFAPVDQKWKVFQRREASQQVLIEMPASRVLHERTGLPVSEKAREPMDILYAAQRALLDWYGPPSVVINSEGDILYFNGRTGKYLEPSSGKINVNVFAMAREGLREELGLALHNAAKQKTAITRSGVRVKSNGGSSTVNLTIRPLADPADLRGMFLVVFEEVADPPRSTVAEDARAVRETILPPAGTTAPPSEIEEELGRTRARLQSTIEEMQAAKEELRSMNEELQSNNEELQSTNEELTSSKEELQSLNEEMQTVNAELQAKIGELTCSNNDMKNLLNGIEIATIFLGNDLGIKRFTPQATRIVNLVPGDVGRPFRDFATKLKVDRLVPAAKEVLDTLVTQEVQVQAVDDRWYNMRILPYRTVDNVIEGVVMTFADITANKQLEESLRQQQVELRVARDYAESVIATIREPLVVLDDELRIVSASRAFYRTFQVTPAETEGRLLYEIGERQWDIGALRQLLEGTILKDAQFDDFRVDRGFPNGTHRVFLLNARRIAGEGRQRGLILLAIEETTAATRPEGNG
jgi:two-component system, chemotaxis family, CheB/CheR fusion protein